MASGKRSQSSKVGQTLQDLEAAFADWEALADQPAEAETAPNDHEKDLKEKTKKLLSQLREQIAELAD